MTFASAYFFGILLELDESPDFSELDETFFTLLLDVPVFSLELDCFASLWVTLDEDFAFLLLDEVLSAGSSNSASTPILSVTLPLFEDEIRSIEDEDSPPGLSSSPVEDDESPPHPTSASTDKKSIKIQIATTILRLWQVPIVLVMTFRIKSPQ
jgi:hypothetical protein